MALIHFALRDVAADTLRSDSLLRSNERDSLWLLLIWDLVSKQHLRRGGGIAEDGAA